MQAVRNIVCSFLIGSYGHVFPHAILVQPERIGVSSNEFIDWQPADQLRSPHTFLSTVDEDDPKRGIAFFLTAFLFLRKSSFVHRDSPDVN